MEAKNSIKLEDVKKALPAEKALTTEQQTNVKGGGIGYYIRPRYR
jgi:hypothetical protein